MECKSIFSFFKTHAVWIISALLFFLGTLVLTHFVRLFISPDETANAFFAQAFAHTGSFRVYDAMNQLYGGILHPRSIVTDGTFLVPGSFMGLVFLYGGILFVFGDWSLTLITPVLVLLASLAWNQILQQWFSKRIAFISSLLFLFHPAIWYYSARGLMPNVLFVCSVIFSCFFLLCFKNKKALSSLTPSLRHSIIFFVSGLFLGLALFVRLSEIYWLAPLFLFILFLERKQFSFRRSILLVFGFALPMCLLLFLNVKTYGNPFTFGYSFVSSTQSAIVTTTPQEVTEEKLSWLLPFGFHPRGIFWHTLDYLLLLFWWLTIPALCALPLVLQESKQKIYTIVTIVVALWLCIWYGSWLLHDNPDPTQITIANSYVRYWLPIFVLSTPLIALSLQWVADRTVSKKHALHILVSLMLLVLALNVRIVFLEGQDALVHVVSTLQQSERIRDQVFKIVPEDGVIITDRSDKIFFPGRHVIVPLRSEQTYTAIPKMIDQTPVYYYGITLPVTDLDFLNQQTFAPVGLQIVFIQSFGVESLYHIQRP